MSTYKVTVKSNGKSYLVTPRSSGTSRPYIAPSKTNGIRVAKGKRLNRKPEIA